MGEVIKAYKGFNKDMTCRGFRYEEGKEYEEERAEACNCGASSATGYKGKSAAENPNSVAVAWGPEAMAKGVKGSTLVLAEWKRIDNDAWYWKEEAWEFVGSLMVRVDGEKVKENTWYTLKNGELVEVKDE